MVNIDTLYALYKELGGVGTDTRKIKPASMFFAIKGPNFNGNHFAQDALDKGAAYAVVDEKDAVVHKQRCLLVPDVLTTMQHLATHHRQALGIPVIAVAGSNGKTTTKELIGAVLNKRY